MRSQTYTKAGYFRPTRSREFSDVAEDIKSKQLKILMTASTLKTTVQLSLTIGNNIQLTYSSIDYTFRCQTQVDIGVQSRGDL